jgi:hypothetical protein
MLITDGNMWPFGARSKSKIQQNTRSYRERPTRQQQVSEEKTKALPLNIYI